MEASFKPILCFGDTVTLVENVTKHLSSGTYDSTFKPAILSLSSNLKHHGSSLESSHRGALDNLQQVLRVACRDKNLDLVSRVHLLEIIELRALKWIPNDHVANFYKNKLSTIKNEIVGSVGLNANAPEFTFRQSTDHNEVLPPQLIPSSPLINLQEPPIGRKAASQETSDVESHSEAGNKEKYTLTLNTTDGDITISSSNKKLFHTAGNILKEKLAHQINIDSGGSSSFVEAARKDKGSKPDLKYSSNMIRELATSPLCLVPPINWDKIVRDVPSMVKSPATVNDDMLGKDDVNDDKLRNDDVNDYKLRNDDKFGNALSDNVKRPRLQ